MAGRKMFYLTEEERQILKELVAASRRRPINIRQPDVPAFAQWERESHYVCLVPGTHIPARSGTTPGSADCVIYFIDDSGTATLTSISQTLYTVYNIYPVKWYGTGTVYARVMRDRFGRWLIEKPTYRHKVTPNADAAAGGASVTCKVYKNGSDTGDTIQVKNNWMNGGVKVSSGKEAIAEYFEDEGQYAFVEAECETS